MQMVQNHLSEILMLTFVPGQFQSFQVTKKFHLGKISEDLPAEAVVEFDGETLKYGKKEVSYPEFRSVFKLGWLRPLVGESVAQALAQEAANAEAKEAARAAVRPSAHKTISHEQREVGKVDQQKSPAQRSNGITTSGSGTKPFNATMVREGDEDSRSVGPSHRTAQTAARTVQALEDNRTVGKISPARTGRFDVTRSSAPDADDSAADRVQTPSPAQRAKAASSAVPSDGEVVGVFRSSNQGRVVVGDTGAADREMRRIQSLKPTNTRVVTVGSQIVAAESDDVNDLIDVLDERTQGRVIAQVNHTRAIQSQQAQANAAYQRALEAQNARGAAKVATQVVQEPVVEEAPALVEALDDLGVLPEVTVKVRAPQSVEELIVQGDDLQITPDFTWNKKLHWKNRAKMAMEIFIKNENGEGAKHLAMIRAVEEKVVIAMIDDLLTKHLQRLKSTLGTQE